MIQRMINKSDGRDDDAYKNGADDSYKVTIDDTTEVGIFKSGSILLNVLEVM